MQDDLGDRMKMYEARETSRRAMPGLPVYARIDGRSFSRFTKDMKRPYDLDLSNLMIQVTKNLVKETNALIGYCQSDEISLVFEAKDPKSEIFFDGKLFKMTSQLAALATSYFTLGALEYWPEKTRTANPVFDARVIELPSRQEAANMILWREIDATKNAISMACRSEYSAKDMAYKKSPEMHDMLMARGINFNDYPAFFKRGTFVQRKPVMKELTPDILQTIPVQYRPSGPVGRHEILPLDMPPFSRVQNREDVIFENAEPLSDWAGN